MAKKLYEDDVLVIGLGRFGGAVALELQKLGHHVVAVERDAALAETFLGKVTRIVQADAAQPQSMSHIKARSFQIAIVGIGSSVEASVLCAMNLVDVGIPIIWAKALTPEHARILEHIGVHHVISPEADSGRRVAHLVNGKLMDYIEFDDGFAIVKMRPPKCVLDEPLAQSKVRTKYGVTIVGVKREGEDFTHATQETVVNDGDLIIVSGPRSKVEDFSEMR